MIQTVAIRSHVLVTLDLAAGNYGQWHRFFRTVIDKFGLADHINPAVVRRTEDPEWVMIDHAVTHWLYITISPELLNVVMQPGDTTVSVWRPSPPSFATTTSPTLSTSMPSTMPSSRTT